MTVGELVTADIETARLKPRTRTARRSQWRRQGAELHDMDVTELRRPDVQDWYSAGRRLRPHAAESALRVLSAAWNRALRRQSISARNPCTGVRVRALPGRQRILTDDEYRRLGLALAQHEGRWPVGCACIRLIALTGCRESEIRCLTWGEVRGGDIHLRDSKVGPRQVWLSDAARDVIDGRRGDHPEWVFVGLRRRSHIETGVLWRLWKRVIAAAGLDGVRLHDLRHSFASLAIRLHVPVPVTQQLMGHRDVKSTMTYVHTSADATRAAVAAVSRSLGEETL